jgi:hypothetical protein
MKYAMVSLIIGPPGASGTAILDSMAICAGEPEPAQTPIPQASLPSPTVIASPNNATGKWP